MALFLRLLPVLFLVFGPRAYTQSTDEKAIRSVLAAQVSAWNRGDITQFMEGYWKSDSLMFIGKSGVVYGYDSTLARYRKAYPSRQSMGSLVFRIVEVRKISDEFSWVVGQWTLRREGDSPGGYYTLLFRKINGRWMIVADHTS